MMLINVFGLLYLSSNWHAIQASHIPFQVTSWFDPELVVSRADPCAAQDLADKIIDAAKVTPVAHLFADEPEITEGARKKMIEAAKTLAGLVDAVGKSKGDGVGADNWNRAWITSNFKDLNRVLRVKEEIG
ncbi:hypothetical protein H4Q26_004997 [Puccinia striiformis f. sp. tritici PST-130]|nr:hypothetical protein H4Q26_004997 [Puccinia striiformis f. sp. tritici PST-130]